jgi:hypothetical protein
MYYATKVNFFFYSLIFTFHRRPKMSKFDTSDKKFIETIFFKYLSPMQTARAICKARRKLVVGCCGERNYIAVRLASSI